MNNSRLYLKFPTLEDKENVLAFKQEFLRFGQEMAGTGGLDRFNTYEEWLEKVKNDPNPNPTSGRVPAGLFLAYTKEGNNLVGMLQIRYQLNEGLLKGGGHIGDCVRPTEQGKGYATEQIGLALEMCKQKEINPVLITCNKTNVASAKTIIKNGGVLENEIEDDGEMVQRYWIELQ